MKWLIVYYPVDPHQQFTVYNVSTCDPFLNDFGESRATSALEQYVFARDHLYKNRDLPVPKIIGYNNSWFMISDKDSVKQAIEEYWESFHKFVEGEEDEEIWCTECPYFKDVVDDDDDWFGSLCTKDGHETGPSMYAIQSLHNHCPLLKQKEVNE